MKPEIEAAYAHWLRSPALDEASRRELAALTDEMEISDRFYKSLAFGTGGIRAVMGAGANRLNRYTVRKTAYGLARQLLRDGALAERGVVIAFDTRNHSGEFAREAADTLLSENIPVFLYEMPVPTPMLSFSVPHLSAAAGIMVTASHNPPAYNGLKVYDECGVQLVPDKANALIAAISACPDPLAVPAPHPVRAPRMLGHALFSDYLSAVHRQSLFDHAADKARLSIVYSPLHGAGRVPVTKILEMDGFTRVFTVPAQCVDDGNFPTVVSPNPEERAALDQAIRLAEKRCADIALCTDPDGDRLGVAVRHNEGYTLLTGNQIGALLSSFVIMERKKALSENDVMIKTVVTGELGAEIARRRGVRVLDTLTGFKYIGEQAVRLARGGQDRFLLGYEESFGFLTGDYARDKDATLSAMLIAELAAKAKAEGKTLLDVLDALYRAYGFYYDTLFTVTLPGERGEKTIAKAMEAFRDLPPSASPEPFTLLDYSAGLNGLPRENLLKFVFSDGAWAAVRPSGTEPKLKLYYSIRGENEACARSRQKGIADRLLAVLQKIGGIQ